MKKNKRVRLFLGAALFVQSMMLLFVIIVLSAQKKSIPKAVWAVLAAGSFASAVLLICSRRDECCNKRLRETDAFYDDEYGFAFDDDDDEDYGLGIDENLNSIREDE
jgi:hypothetical protein